METRFAATLLILILAGCSSKAANPLLSSPDGKAVDAYLKANLNDPSYEVYAWRPPAECDAIRQRFLDHAARQCDAVRAEIAGLEIELGNAKDAADISRIEQRLQHAQEALTFEEGHEEEIKARIVQFAIVKYRARNSSNVRPLVEEVFAIERGKATPETLPELPKKLDPHIGNEESVPAARE